MSLEEKAEQAERGGDLARAFLLWSELATQRRDPDYFCRAGRLAERLENWSEAEAAYLQALKFDPASAVAMECLGALFLARNDGDSEEELQKARNWLLRAASISSNARLLTLLGATYQALGNSEAAKEAFEKALKLDPCYEEA